MFGASRRAKCLVCNRVALLSYPNVELCNPCIDDEQAQVARAQRKLSEHDDDIRAASQEWFDLVVTMPPEHTARWLNIVTAIMLGEDLDRVAATLRRYPVLQPYHDGLTTWRCMAALYDPLMSGYRKIIEQYAKLREVRGG